MLRPVEAEAVTRGHNRRAIGLTCIVHPVIQDIEWFKYIDVGYHCVVSYIKYTSPLNGYTEALR